MAKRPRCARSAYIDRMENLSDIERITTHRSQELAAAAMKMHVAGLDGRIPKKLEPCLRKY